MVALRVGPMQQKRESMAGNWKRRGAFLSVHSRHKGYSRAAALQLLQQRRVTRDPQTTTKTNADNIGTFDTRWLYLVNVSIVVLVNASNVTEIYGPVTGFSSFSLKYDRHSACSIKIMLNLKEKHITETFPFYVLCYYVCRKDGKTKQTK